MKRAPPYTLGNPNKVIKNNYFPPCPSDFVTFKSIWVFFVFFFTVKDGGRGCVERMP